MKKDHVEITDIKGHLFWCLKIDFKFRKMNVEKI